ncbi:protein lifeguard 1-like isoform X1 [Cynoglossus semilaevis]|uniref:protein lifeguard 1-like isoform X1 n=1 Tax=Cynoglossus semilaevis TaxID=244447 RepID=UPI0007DCB624|nr:protein lifeguard 1-like isoform X1 [Cynoglossus semilaevis]
MLSHTMTQSDPHAPRGTNPPQNVVCDCPQPTYVPLQCYQPTAGYRQPGFPHAGPGFAPGPCPHMHYPQMLHPQATYYQAPFHQGPTRTEFRGDPTGGPSGRSGYYGDGHSSQYNYKHCQPITEEGFCVVFEDVAVRQAFIRKVFVILTMQLLVTFASVAFFTFYDEAKTFVREHPWTYFLSYAFFFVPLILLSCCGEFRRKHPWNLIALSSDVCDPVHSEVLKLGFFQEDYSVNDTTQGRPGQSRPVQTQRNLYHVINSALLQQLILTLSLSYMVGMIASYYDTEIVIFAVGITVVVCFTVILFSLQTKLDFTSWYGVLFVCMVVLLLFLILCFFMRDKYLYIIYSTLAALLFTCFLAVDTQRLLCNKKLSMSPEEYVFAALNLYTDIINIFLSILMLTGQTRE